MDGLIILKQKHKVKRLFCSLPMVHNSFLQPADPQNKKREIETSVICQLTETYLLKIDFSACFFKQMLNPKEFKDHFHDTYFLLQFSEFPDPMLCSDYVQLLNSPPCCEQKCSTVSWEELKSMDLPSFEPAFLVLCRVLLNVIHECLKLRLEQRPAGEPSLLSIKQVCFKSCFF